MNPHVFCLSALQNIIYVKVGDLIEEKDL